MCLILYSSVLLLFFFFSGMVRVIRILVKVVWMFDFSIKIYIIMFMII